ncbi:MAG: hypothetical protein HKN73_18270 [Gemmatimonadetes bacterium]|nr:hypothetical protein [Gemmatimonadota bacterium]
MTHVLMLEKRPREVRLYLTDGREIPVVIYMAPDPVETSVSGESVADAVQEAAPVLPCKTEAGDFLGVGTEAIAAVGVRARDTWDEGFFHLRPCTVRLRGGHQFDGFIRHYAGTGDRLSDALRRPEEWIQLEVGPEVVWFRVDRLITALEHDPGSQDCSSPSADETGLEREEDPDPRSPEHPEAESDELFRSISDKGAQL